MSQPSKPIPTLQDRACVHAQADLNLGDVTTQAPKDLGTVDRRWFMWWYELARARLVKSAKAGNA